MIPISILRLILRKWKGWNQSWNWWKQWVSSRKRKTSISSQRFQFRTNQMHEIIYWRIMKIDSKVRALLNIEKGKRQKSRHLLLAQNGICMQFLTSSFIYYMHIHCRSDIHHKDFLKSYRAQTWSFLLLNLFIPGQLGLTS